MVLRHFSFLLKIIVLVTVLVIPLSSQTIVGEFGKYKITLDEFEYAYSKNVGGWEVAQEDSFQQYKDFMELYMKFRMKLRNAQVRGLGTDPALEKELSDYQEQVGKSYIIEKHIIQPGLKELYQRRKEEIRVSHIMIKPGEGGNEPASEKANALLDSIKGGVSFEEIAEKYSDDKFSGPKGGDIFFVTAGMLPVEFEDAMYTLQSGDVYSEPIKTNFGYHLIKVTQRGERIPKIKAKHILISYYDNDQNADSLATKLTADSVYAMLQEGADFGELVEKYSDDTGTAQKGGDLGFFERRQMVQAFDEMVFSMKIGEISEPVQTNYGYHIIMVTDIQSYPGFDDDRENLLKTYKKQRYDNDYANYINGLKSKYNFNLNEQTVNIIVENSDSVRFGIEYPNPVAIEDKVLFTYAGNSVSGVEFIKETNSNSEFAGKPVFVKEEVMKAVEKISEDDLMYVAALDLVDEDPNFAALMDEYRNGVYIFKLQEDEVWNKLEIDSTRIYNYWAEHKENYSFPDRVSFGEIFSTRDSLIQKYYQLLKDGADFDSLAAIYTERQGKKKDNGFYQLQDVNFSDLSREANKIRKEGEFIEPIQFSGGYSIFKLYKRDLARLKTFEEARAEVAGLVQEQESKRLADSYINSLENIYHPVIFYDELRNAFSKKEKN
jgi:peptidyl-prolyl cis-trans isomerase SurA